jgi:hypothetical protein
MATSYKFFQAAAVAASTSAAQNSVPLPSEAPHFARIRQVVISAASSTSTTVPALETAVGSTANLAAGKCMLVPGSNNALWLGDAVAASSNVEVFGDQLGEATQPAAAYTATVR